MEDQPGKNKNRFDVNKLRLVPFERDDIEQIMGIELKSFSAPWPRETYLNLDKQTDLVFLVAKYHHIVVGYTVYWVLENKIEADSRTIAVHESYRRYGVAQKLMEYTFNDLKAKKVERVLGYVRPSNIVSARFLKKMGFVEFGIQKNYYPDNGEDCILLRRELD